MGPTLPPLYLISKTLTLMSLILSLPRTSSSPLYLTVCSALRSDQLRVLIDTTCRTSFQHLLDRPDFKRVDWVLYQACLDDRLPGNPLLNVEKSIDKCAEELSNAIQEALAASAPSVVPVQTHCPLYLPELGMNTP
jgi:hypothetical protein